MAATDIRIYRRLPHARLRYRSVRLGRFILSETRYAGGLRTPRHADEAPTFCLVLSGRYVQSFRRREVVYRPSIVVFRPAGAEHADRVAPAGAACFIVEPDPTWLADSGLDHLNREYGLEHGGCRARWLAEHAFAEFRAPDGVTPLALEGLVLALGAEFARIPDPGSGPRSPAGGPCGRRCRPWRRSLGSSRR